MGCQHQANTLFKSRAGFTLVEVLIAIVLFVVTVVVFFATIVTCSYVASYSTHKIQAIYVAKRIIEEKRRLSFPLVSTGGAWVAYGPVSIDTKGTFNNAGDDYMGQAFFAVTNVDPYRQTIQVDVVWQEHAPAGNILMRERCATDFTQELA